MTTRHLRLLVNDIVGGNNLWIVLNHGQKLPQNDGRDMFVKQWKLICLSVLVVAAVGCGDGEPIPIIDG